MAERSLRYFHSAGAMRIGSGAERGITNRRVIDSPMRVLRKRMRILKTNFHEEIMRMLAIHDGNSVGSFTCLKEQRVAPIRDGGGLKTEHSAQHNAARAHVVQCAQHAPVGGPQFVAAPRI